MALTPYITQDKAPDVLKNAAIELIELDAALDANILESLRSPMIHLQRQVNAYYSNKIEGNSASAADVLRADKSPSGAEVALDLVEIEHHIEAQIRLSIDPVGAAAISRRESIARLHCEIYSGLPEQYLRVDVEGCGEAIRLTPGEIRTRGVRVGYHIPPPAEDIGSYLTWFENAYRLNRLHGLAPLLAAAGAHHRLLWLHPFFDGNGRMGRLFTDEYLKAGGMKGYGLWSMNRGFGRNVDAYYTALRAADHPRKGDLDGRGRLSDSGLLDFTEYFITTALAQVRFVSALLEPRALNRRIDHYFQMRHYTEGMIATGKVQPRLRIEALHVFRNLLVLGPMQCSEIETGLGLGQPTTRDLLDQMACEGLIAIGDDMRVSMRLSEHAIMTLFPDLF
ncbi:Fic family protein [Pseudomonas sp. LS-2]|uniref:Fic family protein n=1 Tax=Pseudomonas sp. LS-2 TaxID=2315859 RepID=UPI000E75DCEE|nr:Fic family protein [Pseudomonas sp. LS-2]RJX77832.1 Fic family protein [Pseudomonas sp. LS-2]